MKTFTEFSTLVLRRAAAAKAANASLEGDALVEALAAALSTPAERVPRLLEALELVGDNLENVRLVRVYQGETGPHGAVSRGEFHYALDRVVTGSGRGERRDQRQGGGGRGERGGGGGRGGGERGGGGGFGGDRGRDKPRGLSALMKTASGEKTEGDKDDRPQRGEIPRAGLGWQLTSAPREFRGGGDDRGGRPRGPRPPGRGRPGGGPGGPGGPGGDDRGRRGPRPQGDRPRGPRPEGGGGDRAFAPRDPNAAPRPPRDPNAPPRPPRDPNAPRRERRPLGPDANGMGPDGKPWDPERKTKRDAERATRLPAGAGDAGADTQAPAAEAAPAAPAAPSEE
jgi:hypothetical protein